MEQTLKAQVEAAYGRPITDAEYDDAEAYAAMKLDFQAKLFGRSFDDAYRGKVIVETINQNRLYKQDEEDRRILAELVERDRAAREAAEDKWVKEVAHEVGTSCAAVRMIVRSYLSTHIVAQSRTNCNMGA